MKEYINLGLAVMCLMISNAFLGITLSKLKKEFKKEILLNGLIKCIGILIGMALMIVAGSFSTEIVVANINGADVNILGAMEILMTAIITWYGAQNINKLFKMFSMQKDITTPSEDQNNEEEQTTFDIGFEASSEDFHYVEIEGGEDGI